jgi:hypothetical protein
MENRYVVDGFGGRTGNEGRDSNEGGMFLIKQENPDKGFKVFLLDVPAKLPE